MTSTVIIINREQLMWNELNRVAVRVNLVCKKLFRSDLTDTFVNEKKKKKK